ncbi:MULTISPECIES: hypothetical protein [Yersinia pseudotuberculosis complex]|uniref:hypothetical protein n=1 Tax=Yersinia pseudotuberculosis complex TaxID=1649845 RepID=UPI0005E67484|nr:MULTISPECIES: hypothetical protein [Yersinia pseudotuberculosis complex]MBO1548743.1 hypothetical protein [Yersinia pseudotuberculosis]MBO1554581.1 hypothetical protein [Yersinia pseudotuberculosis]MBO1568978.1 hypothetical protein [Yersinia pseudotuberculosis]MBO1583709.1 hypothetical protein [Yersinia pseudotuberculosis]MBO1633662.1 hypothetical protein [Yersinia pseudotuberculosis]
MTDEQFTELVGRIEGVARTVMILTAILEETGSIDGPRLAAGLRGSIRPTAISPPLLLAAQQTLHEIADELDKARSYRQSRR